MTSIITAKTNFTGGVITPALLGRVDLKAYDNGALALENVFVEPTGGIYRRPGLRYLTSLSGKARLLSYEIGPGENFLIVLTHLSAKIYQDGTCQATLTTPWKTDDLNLIRWTTHSEGLFLTHPDYVPQKISLSNDTWAIENFSFLTENNVEKCPYHKFAKDSISIAASAINGNNITLTASEDLFDASYIGKTLKLASGYVLITAVGSAQSATANVKDPLLDDLPDNTALEATRSWGEPVFSSQKGYPCTVTVYQKRLVFGGSPALPNMIWFSQTDDIHNFETGDGMDAEAITFAVESDQSNKICALFAGRHLQIFTTSAEWMVTGHPVTPYNITLTRQTQVGSKYTPFVPPLAIDGATIFAGQSGHEIREFLFDEIYEMYQATDLSLMAAHLIKNPIDLAYDKKRKMAFVVMQEGTLSVLTTFRAEEIQSWTEQKTNGAFCSVAVADGVAYFVVLRDGTYSLEYLDDTCATDCAFKIQSASPTDTITGLTALEGQTVAIIADNIVQTNKTVNEGSITLDEAGKDIEIGLPFAHTVVPLPPAASAHNGPAPIDRARLVRATFRVINTDCMEIDTGNGLQHVLVPNINAFQLDKSFTNQSTDILVNALSWKKTMQDPLWKIQSFLPRSFKLLSVVQQIKIGG